MDNSPGFMYYSLDTSNNDSKNTKEPQQGANQSSDYLSFDTSNQSQASDLNQSFYSSPNASNSTGISHNYRSPYGNNRKNQRWWNDRGGRSRGNNSPRGNFHNRSGFNNSYDQQKDKSDCSIYLHSSFTEDPWKNLEQFCQYQKTEDGDKN